MKRRIIVSLLLVLALAASIGAQASYSPVYSKLVMRLATRSGPSTDYNELGTYFPNDWYNQSISAFSKVSNNNIWWVQVEFTYKGELYRAYTGEQRLSISTASLPVEQKIGTGRTKSNSAAKGSTGPGSNYKQTTYTVPAGIDVTVFDVDNGYAQIDYLDSVTRFRHRCWIPLSNIDISYYSSYNQYQDPYQGQGQNQGQNQGQGWDTYIPDDDWSQSYGGYQYTGNEAIAEGDVFIWTGDDDTGFVVSSDLDYTGHATLELTVLGAITYHNLDLYMDSTTQGSFMTLDGREGVLYFYDYYAILQMDLNFAGIGNEFVLLKY